MVVSYLDINVHFLYVDVFFKEVSTRFNGTKAANELITLTNNSAARISIPREVFLGLEETKRVMVVSFLYRNMSGLLPESLEKENIMSVQIK